MPQIKNPLTEARIPFAKMSYTPDVPSTALGPNEYNVGSNIETDVRGIRSVAGDQEILATVPGTPIYITGGFRTDPAYLEPEFWFVVATLEMGGGRWYASRGNGAYGMNWEDITPNTATDDAQPVLTGYDRNTRITEAWNGTVLILNDNINPPMWLPSISVDNPTPILIFMADSTSVNITGISTATPAAGSMTITGAGGSFATGSYITITGTNPTSFTGTYYVQAGDSSGDLVVASVNTDTWTAGGAVQSASIWNYNPAYKSVTAGFLRSYSTPNVGTILVAGDLTITDQNDAVSRFPATVQWSQAFGLNQVPQTWQPTILNVANQLEVPLRGPALDAFPANGQFFICSYWDTVVFSPINYSTTSAPIIGVRLFNTGRGLISTNACTNTDRTVYGVDARDIWVFDGNDFTGLGNQRVKNWFYDQVDQTYFNRVFMQNNTQKNQIEIYYPDADATDGEPNRMLAYRYDLDIWQAPRDVRSAAQATESPVWAYDTEWNPNLASRTIVYCSNVADSKLVQKDQGYAFVATMDNPSGNIASVFRRDNIKLLNDYSGKMMVHRILPEVENLNDAGLTVTPGPGDITVTIEGANSVGSTPVAKTPVTIPVDADGSYNLNPWAQINQNAFRVNTIQLSNTSNSDIWMCSATTWQFTQVEDDR